jgi:histone H3/H4
LVISAVDDMKKAHNEFETISSIRKYQTDTRNELRLQALERIVRNFNSGLFSEVEADECYLT